ncbi:MAG: bile acid:sodium symporter family protein [Candidatus Methanofastidiosia archaeon]
MRKEIESNFSLFIALALVVGLIVPNIAKEFNPYIVYILMGVMFFTMLKIDTRDLMHTASSPIYLLYLTLIILIVTPIVFYFFAMMVYPEVVAATLIIASLPAAMVSTSFTDLLKGNVHIALLLTVATSLIAPFSIPFFIKIFIGVETDASAFEMMTLLAKVIFVPFILAILTKKAVPAAIERTKIYYPLLNIFLLFFIIIGPIGKNAAFIKGNLDKAVVITLFFFVMSVSQHVMGWCVSFWRPLEDRIASATTIAYCNVTLGIVFASEFFSPIVVLGVVLYEVVWDLMPIPFHYIIKKISLKEKK